MTNYKNKQSLKKAFNRAAHSYDDNNQLQCITGDKLVALLKPYQSSSARIIDLGCGTGLVTQKLASSIAHAEMHAIDLSPELLQQAKQRLAATAVQVYESDFENMDGYCFDMVFSNMALHWGTDFEGVLRNIACILKKGGVAGFSIPLAGTLSELEPHCALNRFFNLDFIIECLVSSGFEVLVGCCEDVSLEFADTVSGLRSIKGVGANFVGERLHRGLRGKRFFAGVTVERLTYRVGYFVVRNGAAFATPPRPSTARGEGDLRTSNETCKETSVRVFVAGTDTDVGKTYVSAGMLRAFNLLGFATLGVKPVASGCINHVSDDALTLQKTASIQLPYQCINPFAFTPAIAPHIAAAKENQSLNVKTINHHLQYTLTYPADVCLIEGVGGWHVPLNDKETMADFVISNQLPVILVVGIRLGCLNHSILTYQSMQQGGANVIGWIANCITADMPFCAENIATLHHWLPIPCLGVVNHHDQPEDKIDVKSIIQILSKSSHHP